MKSLFGILAAMLMAFGFSGSLQAKEALAGTSDAALPVWVSAALEGGAATGKSAQTNGFFTANESPRCGHYDGLYCGTEGAMFRCMWQAYEPGMCFCSDNTWTCG